MNSTSAEAGVEFPGEISARRLQDLIRPPQLTVLPFEFRDALLVVTRGTRPLPAVNFRFLDPVAESLGVDAQLLADACQRATRAARLGTQLEYHRHRAFPQLGGMLFP